MVLAFFIASWGVESMAGAEYPMIPSEGERLIPPNTEFKVSLSISCHQARLLNARYATIPDNVDLVILEVTTPRHFVDLFQGA